MSSIGGNTAATIQVPTITKNAIGEHVATWQDAQTINGWLDLSSGNSGYTTYASKVQESTHILICDYVSLPAEITAENVRMVIGGKTYDVLLIDNPMELCKQLEFYLKFTGGQ